MSQIQKTKVQIMSYTNIIYEFKFHGCQFFFSIIKIGKFQELYIKVWRQLKNLNPISISTCSFWQNQYLNHLVFWRKFSHAIYLYIWDESCKTENITHFCHFFFFFKQVSRGYFNSYSILSNSCGQTRFMFLGNLIFTIFSDFFHKSCNFCKKIIHFFLNY